MRLIINGDDFGLSESCSRAIGEALRRGLITHTTMMATGDYFREAAGQAVRQGFADRVGVHFNLTEGRPLTRPITAVGAFVRNGAFCKDYLRQPRPLSEEEQQAVRTELSAQLERIRQAGMAALHADSHHYIHTLLGIAPIAAQVCRAHGVRRIRLDRTFDTPAHPRVTAGRIGNPWWREQGFVTTDCFGRLSDVAGKPLAGDTEIMVHPDYDRRGRLIDRRGREDGFPVGEPLLSAEELTKLIDK